MKIVAQNKSANFEYFLLDNFEAGIVLDGNEIKSIRSGHLSLNESFVTVKDNNVYLKNAYIAPYEKAYSFGFENSDPRADRKLLLHKNEIAKLKKAKEQDGLTIVPTKAYFKNKLLKVEIAIARGKKLYDKRETIKQRDLSRKENPDFD